MDASIQVVKPQVDEKTTIALKARTAMTEVDGRQIPVAEIADCYDPLCGRPGCDKGMVVTEVPTTPGVVKPMWRARVCRCAAERWRAKNPAPRVSVSVEVPAAPPRAGDTHGKRQAARLREALSAAEQSMGALIAKQDAAESGLRARMKKLDEEYTELTRAVGLAEKTAADLRRMADEARDVAERQLALIREQLAEQIRGLDSGAAEAERQRADFDGRRRAAKQDIELTGNELDSVRSPSEHELKKARALVEKLQRRLGECLIRHPEAREGAALALPA